PTAERFPARRGDGARALLGIAHGDDRRGHVARVWRVRGGELVDVRGDVGRDVQVAVLAEHRGERLLALREAASRQQLLGGHELGARIVGQAVTALAEDSPVARVDIERPVRVAARIELDLAGLLARVDAAAGAFSGLLV